MRAVVVPVGDCPAAAARTPQRGCPGDAPLGHAGRGRSPARAVWPDDARGAAAFAACLARSAHGVLLCNPQLCAPRPQEVAAAFSTARGGFRPGVPHPKQPDSQRRSSRDSRATAFDAVLKEARAGNSDGADGGHLLRTLFREARAFRDNAALRAQAARLRARLSKFRCAARPNGRRALPCLACRRHACALAPMSV